MIITLVNGDRIEVFCEDFSSSHLLHDILSNCHKLVWNNELIDKYFKISKSLTKSNANIFMSVERIINHKIFLGEYPSNFDSLDKFDN